ncbi:hypothetical protein [Streptomyces chartreusis]|uniref:hypothetical protein n=1 Tax=Streptomyces chartreusis TaxID=1969 RepID=UPI00380297A1
MLRKGAKQVSRAGVMRLRTVEDIDALNRKLHAMRARLVACPDESDEVRALVHACATMTAAWSDDLACRFADTSYNTSDLFTAAWELLQALPSTPSGFETAADVALFEVLRDAAAEMLARLWIIGYLIGPVPTGAWPNSELARTLLQALEHHADDRTLTDDLRQAGLAPPSDLPEG